MKPARFAYAAPDRLDDALALLERHGGDAKVLAGGQSLVPMLNLRLARPQALIDVNRIAALSGVREEAGEVRIGSTTRQRDVELELPSLLPLVTAALAHVGHVATRSRGTIGGSVAHADPAAELPAVLLTLDGSVVATSPRGERVIAAADFLRGALTTCLEEDEILTEVRFPRRADAGHGFVEFARRHGDFALVGAAVELQRRPDGACERVAITAFGVAEVPVRITQLERDLVGRDPSGPEVAREAAAAVAGSLSAGTDIHATGAYRDRVAGVAVARAIAQACSPVEEVAA